MIYRFCYLSSVLVNWPEFKIISNTLWNAHENDYQPIISALFHFTFPKLPLNSFTKISFTSLLPSWSYMYLKIKKKRHLYRIHNSCYAHSMFFQVALSQHWGTGTKLKLCFKLLLTSSPTWVNEWIEKIDNVTSFSLLHCTCSTSSLFTAILRLICMI